MDATNIRTYGGLMQELGLSALEITENGATLRLERNFSPQAPAAVPAMATLPAPVAAEPAPAPAAAPEAPTEDPNIVAVTSPMVGVFYAAATEKQKPFVAIGDKVKKGDVLCVIEAMKLMNEIVCEFSGVVTEICVGNQQVVDYGHVLFRIRKEGP